MIDLTKIEDVRALQSYARVLFDTPSGKEFMNFLEQICGWYQFNEIETNQVLIANGKRQILATIKTLLEHSPEQIVAVANQHG